ncbi:MAG: hypothetical protein EA351_09650 [Gemmatimonadales bacterium]|nr:MAG: hypothetical protein EA351_09650 [Gemmatimonadales bacterium]
MNLDFALIADAATVDGGGKLSVLGIFDRIRAREFPARHGRIALVMRLAAGPEDAGGHEADIRLVDPKGEQVLRLDGTLRVGEAPPGASGAITRVPHVLNLDGITFKVPGVYEFEIRIDGDLVSTLPLTLEELRDDRRFPGQGSSQGPEGVPVVFAPGGPAEA